MTRAHGLSRKIYTDKEEIGLLYVVSQEFPAGAGTQNNVLISVMRITTSRKNISYAKDLALIPYLHGFS